MTRFNPNTVMAKDMKVILSIQDNADQIDTHIAVLPLPLTAFNIRSAIQLLEQEHAKLTGKWADAEGDKS